MYIFYVFNILPQCRLLENKFGFQLCGVRYIFNIPAKYFNVGVMYVIWVCK